MVKERISRRGALKLAGLAGGAILSGAALGGIVRLRREIIESGLSSALLTLDNSRSIEAESLLKHIKFYPSVLVSPGNEEKIRVNFNKDRFAGALIDTAEYVLGENGPAMVWAILEKKPLKIVVNPTDIKSRKNEETLLCGSYFPFRLGGPEIGVYRTYLVEYSHDQRGGNLSQQLIHDKVIYHEMVHFMLDIRSLLPSSVKMTETDREAETLITTESIVNKLNEDYLFIHNKESIDGWPFGNFFSFS